MADTAVRAMHNWRDPCCGIAIYAREPEVRWVRVFWGRFSDVGPDGL